MSTTVAHRRPGAAVAIPERVTLPPTPPPVVVHEQGVAQWNAARRRWGAAAEREREGMFVGLPPRPPVLRPDERRAAETALVQMAPMLAPIDLPGLFAWLGPVNAAVRNPQSREDFDLRCRGLHALLDDVPAGAFTHEARKRLPAFFPAADDIRAAVKPDAERLVLRRSALQDALGAATAAPEPEPKIERPSPEQVEQNRRAVAALRAENAGMVGARPGASSPVPMAPKDLIAAYERVGSPGALYRAALLRKQFPG